MHDIFAAYATLLFFAIADITPFSPLTFEGRVSLRQLIFSFRHFDSHRLSAARRLLSSTAIDFLTKRCVCAAPLLQRR